LRPAIDLGAERRRHQLRPEAHPERRPVEFEPLRETALLAGDPRKALVLVDPHRPAHHDHEVGLAQVERREPRVADVDPVEHVARGLDRLAKPGDPLVGHVTDDETGLHPFVLHS
jgi:hypothetical protein